jgi:hypothetical protein
MWKPIFSLPLILLALSACSTTNSAATAGARAAIDAQASEAHVRSHMAINICPAGYHASNVGIAGGSDAFIGIRNGATDAGSAANGQRRQSCVRNH